MMISRLKCVTLRPSPPTTKLGRGQLFLLLLLFSNTIHAAGAGGSKSRGPPIAVRGCQDRCGNVSIPYPFGIGPDPKCFLNPWYRVNCTTENYSPSIPRAFLASLEFSVSTFNKSYHNNHMDIISIKIDPITLPSSPNTPLLTLSVQVPEMIFEGFNDTGKFDYKIPVDMRRSPFRLMPLLNTLLLVGCNGTAALTNNHDQILVGCTSVCPDANDGNHPDLVRNIKGSSCYGIGCCQASVPKSLDYFQMELRATLGSSDCFYRPILAYASHLADTSVTGNNTYLDGDALTILQWNVLERPHSNSNTTICSYYSDTLGEGGGGGEGYICRCKYEYTHGNPYLPHGCQVIKECEDCPEHCKLFPNQTHGCPIVPVYPPHSKSTLPLTLGLGISLGSISLFIILYGLFLLVKARRVIRQRKINFRKNGGLLFQQQLSTREGAFERSRVFTCDELERATDNFHENRILGRGGQGTVYKGMLLDGTIVAIKKSKKVNESQLGQFINEVVILSQINHRNVVKLFGCCLETEVPLLVYEFVLNDNLYRHIHNPKEDFRITWKMRLRIAIESAEALRYLHSSSSTPIYHRDIKTSNILLDERYRAKIADFGISRTVSVDQTHVTTNVQGTFGYIDPQYFQSHQFTEKSDVYSFGVVLLELLTSKKPVYVDKDMDPRSLASEFLLCMQQSRLCDLVDDDVLQEAQMEVIEGVADLAMRCLSLNGNMRPTMHEVSMTLQSILAQNDVPHSSSEHVVDSGKRYQMYMVNEGLFNISPPPTSTDDSFMYTQPLLFDTDSSI